MKKIVKISFLVLLALFVGFIIFRIVLLDLNNGPKQISPTESAVEAYESGEEILTHDIPAQISDNGYFRAYNMVWLPKSGELQVTVKYNLSIYDKEGLADGTKFSFKMYTSESSENTDTAEEADIPTAEIFGKNVQSETKGIYGYYRIVFSGVTIPEGKNVDLVMCLDDGSKAFSAMSVHRDGQEFSEYDLSRSEKKLLDDAYSSSAFTKLD